MGTGFLVAAVVGSGIMISGPSADTGVALLANTVATAAILVVPIAVLGPVSGAHFNPAVSLVMAWRGLLPRRELASCLAVQVAGALLAAGAMGWLLRAPAEGGARGAASPAPPAAP
jgi:glycerol uptake facilitator-like aquaporin